MAYINVASWTPDQVTDWLKGLDDSMYNYVNSFTNNEVNGQKLLNIRPYELEQLGMVSIGHQEIVLEAVENLRNFHYNLDKENLQFLALQVASASQNLFRQLTHYCDKSKIETQILNDITRTIATIKPLVAWLERAPFKGHLQFNEIRKNILRLGLEMATMAQRDRFVENPVDQIHATAKKLAKLADYIIQDITDPMLLQPAALNLVTLKKRESELGFNLVPSYHGIHRVTEIKYNSPAHTSGKIEDGDEIVQINYQTVVGWQYKTVILHLRESPPDVLLTLKKRPKHTKIYGQIYMQPYRLPSKKRALTTRWGDNLPSPRANFLAVPDFNLPLKITEKNATNSSDTDSSCSDDILTPTDPKSADKEIRMYYPKPRAVLQRRNTICGDELSYFKNIAVPLWHERKTGGIQSGDPSSPSLRDKSVSFGFGLEIAPRPTTCIGITGNGGKYNELVGLNNSLPEITKEKDKLTKQKENENGCDIIRKTQNSNSETNSKAGVCKVVRFGSNMKIDDYPVDNKYICNVENTILETFEPIPYADDEDDSSQEVETPKIPIEISPKIFSFEKDARAISNTSNINLNNNIKLTQNVKIEPEFCQAINTALLNRRGRLDKSHSTPTYDNSGEESDTPPAIEPRKEFLLNTPPLPPPRPKKQTEPMSVPVPPPKPQNLTQNFQIQMLHSATSGAPSITTSTIVSINTPSPPIIPPHRPVHILHKQEATVSPTSPEQSDFELPVKTKGLTLKKKNSLMAKRRKISLKIIGTGDIQGHLYRRTKDKRGVTYWAKLYFVLIETVLYGFRTKDAQKANCMIFLPGFTVSLAEEVHSKPFAFKVYHAAKTFYFAAESTIALSQWMDFIRKAALKDSQQHQQPQGYEDINPKELFSETDSSGDESATTKQLCTPSPITTPTSTRDILNSQVKTNNSETPTTSKSDNKYLGSLKKLTKSSLNFKHSSNTNTSNSSNEKKKSSDIPEPTEQFRTFRKKPGGSFGVQIGTGVSINSSYLDNNYSPQPQINSPHQNQVQHFFPPETAPRKLSLTIAAAQSLANKDENRRDETSSTPGTPNQHLENDNQNTSIDKEPKKLKKPSPHSFIHASNPNLIEFDQMSKTLEMPKMNSSNTWDTHNNLQGFQGLTLKDLMLQKQEEEAQDMYNNRVLLGVEKKDKAQRNQSNISKAFANFENNEHGNMTITAFNKSRIQMRSLPKTPDYEMSFKLDDEDIKRTRTKEGLKLRDFGYELIPGDEPAQTVNNNSNNEHHSKKHKIITTYHTIGIGNNTGITVSNKKKYSVSNASEHQEKSSRGGSFKKHIGKFEAFKTSSEKIFQFKHNSDDLKNLKAVSSYTPMTLPLNKKSSHLYNIQDQQNKIKKSQTYNNEFKEPKRVIEEKSHHRKNSAPMPILSKFPFSSSGKTTKEKKLLGSPRLHRAIFGRSSNRIEQDYDHEIFCPITFTKSPPLNSSTLDTSSISSSSNSENQINSVVEPINQQNSTPISPTSSQQQLQSQLQQQQPQQQPQQQQQQQPQVQSSQPPIQTPEYPNMECPPVFEPETYSLSDPNASLTLLRRRNTFEENA